MKSESQLAGVAVYISLVSSYNMRGGITHVPKTWYTHFNSFLSFYDSLPGSKRCIWLCYVQKQGINVNKLTQITR